MYVATDDFSPETQDALVRAGCKTFTSIPGSGEFKSWEGAAMDQFLMADATEFITMVGLLYRLNAVGDDTLKCNPVSLPPKVA